MSNTGRAAPSGYESHAQPRSRSGGEKSAAVRRSTSKDPSTLPLNSGEHVVHPSEPRSSSFTPSAATDRNHDFPHAARPGVAPSDLLFANAMQLQGPPRVSPLKGTQCAPQGSVAQVFHDTVRTPVKENGARVLQHNSSGGSSSYRSLQPHQPQNSQMPASSAHGYSTPSNAGFAGFGAVPPDTSRSAGAAVHYTGLPAANTRDDAPCGIKANEYIMVRPEFLQMLLQQHQQSRASSVVAAASACAQDESAQPPVQHTAQWGGDAAVTDGRRNGCPSYANSGQGNPPHRSNQNNSGSAMTSPFFLQTQQQRDGNVGRSLPSKGNVSVSNVVIRAPPATTSAAGATALRVAAASTPNFNLQQTKGSNNGRYGTEYAHGVQINSSSCALGAKRSQTNTSYTAIFQSPTAGAASLKGDAASHLHTPSYPHEALPPPPLPANSATTFLSGGCAPLSPPLLPAGGVLNTRGGGGGLFSTLLPPPPPPLPSDVKSAGASAKHHVSRNGKGGPAGYSMQINNAKTGMTNAGRRGSRNGASHLEQQHQQHQQQQGEREDDSSAAGAASGGVHRRGGATNTHHSHYHHRSGSIGSNHDDSDNDHNHSGYVETKNGANFVVGGWYEGVVKRYNPLRGFGFLTCTHQLHFDFRACEQACTRNAEDVYERQQRQELEKAVVAATPLCGGGGGRGANDDGAEDKPGPLTTACTDARSMPAAPSPASLKAGDPPAPHSTGAPNPLAEEPPLHHRSNTDVDAARLEEGSLEATANGKMHGTVVYSTMQWYLHTIDDKSPHSFSSTRTGDTAAVAAAAAAAEEGKDSAPSNAALAVAETDKAAGEEETEYNRSDLAAPTTTGVVLRKLEREAMQVGDIFVHHSCISMGGFRVFVPGTVVRFSVAVLMDTVQAVDVVPLGPEWATPRPPAEMTTPPLYKVSSTAATVLRYHRHSWKAVGEPETGGPHSRVGSTSVQWTDMAVIPTAAIPNSVEGMSELLIVRVPAANPPVSTMTETATSTRSGSVTASAADAAKAVKIAAALPAPHATTTAEEEKQAKESTATTTAGNAPEASTTSPLVVELGVVAPPDRMKAASYQNSRDSSVEWATATPQSVPRYEEMEKQSATTARALLEKDSSTEFNGVPTAFSGGGLTSSKTDTHRGHHRAAAATETNGTGSRNITAGTTTTVAPTQSSGHTGSHGCEAGMQRGRVVVHRLTPTGSSGDQEEPMSSRNMGGPQMSSTVSGEKGNANEKGHRHDGRQPVVKEEIGKVNDGGKGRPHHKYEPNAPAAVNNTITFAAAPQEPVYCGSPNLASHEGVDFHGGSINPLSSSICCDDSDDKDAATTMSTSRSGNTLSDCNPGPTPDWTEFFERKMANERTKDILMHKMDLRFFPHRSAKSAAAAAAAALSALGGGDAAGDGGAAVFTPLHPEVVPLSAAGELDSSSSRGMEEEEVKGAMRMMAAAAASDSLGEGRRHNLIGGGEADPSSSQLPTPEDPSGQTGTIRTATSEERRDSNSGDAAPAVQQHCAKSKKSGERAVDDKKRRNRSSAAVMSTLVMVAVSKLPPSLATQVPRGVTVIALPKATAKELRIESLPMDSTNAALLSTPAEPEVPLPSFSNPQPPQPQRSSPEFSPWPSMPASSPSASTSSDGDCYHHLMMAAGNITTSSDSRTRPLPGKQQDPHSSASARIVFPFVTELPGAPAVAATAGTIVSAAKSHEFPLSSVGVESSDMTTRSRLLQSSAMNTALTLLSSHSTPVPPYMVDMPLPPWMRDTEPPPQQQQQQQQQQMPNRGNAVYSPAPEHPHKPSLSQPYPFAQGNDAFLPLNCNTAKRSINRPPNGTSPGVNQMTDSDTFPQL